jgi:hypothetical protein
MQKGRKAKTARRVPEANAEATRSGRPNPDKDAAKRTTHPKGSYGGEGGSPRAPRGITPETPRKRDR